MRVPARGLGLTEMEEQSHEMEEQSHGERAEENEYYSEENSRSSCKDRERLIYIRTVQHLIEKCLLFHMDRRECLQALAKHAGVHPLVTLTVWKGLVRENKDFFRTYFLHKKSQPFSCSHGDRNRYTSHRR